MSFLSKWFHGDKQQEWPPTRPDVVFSKTAPPPGPRYAPGTRIAYDDGLITHLLDEHRKLLSLFTSISNAFVRGDFTHTVTFLRQFKSNLAAHLLTENVRLYVYLEHTFTDDEFSHILIHNMHQEMDAIGRNVLAFLSKYDALDRDPVLSQSFAAAANNIGQILSDRIKREEETLYPLYMPIAQTTLDDVVP
ncbi:MAG: hemerythrin domain-containing protein [Burkholderiaceae bacterium]|jgi:hemerythrin-like domain-containing protein|nr:hemerythrin domain-containing protein [Burkholderiaceae bacterium]